MERNKDGGDTLDLHVKRRLVELKTLIGEIECRIENFETSRQSIRDAKEDAEKLGLLGEVRLLSKEVINICLSEYKHWVVKGQVDKALAAHMSAAVALSSTYKSMDDYDAKALKDDIFASGVPNLWNLGTYYHRQGNANLLAGLPKYEVLPNWETAIKCYLNVQKLYKISIFLGANVSDSFFNQAQCQIRDITDAKHKLLSEY
jgi:hypothetical protein